MGTNPPFIDIHTHQMPTGSNIAIINIFPNQSLPESVPDFIYISSGIHPWYLDQWTNQFDNLVKIVGNKRIIAIGECGLDLQITSNLKVQEEVLRIQAELAEKKQIPMIIHCVKAYNEIIRIRKELNPQVPWIIHGFNSSTEIAKQCIDAGMLLSFGSLLFEENPKTIRVIKDIPVSATFFETDERKIPIDEVYKKYASTKNILLETLTASITSNFMSYFKISQPE